MTATPYQIRGIDAMIRALYASFEEMKEASGRVLPAEDAALQMALAKHSAIVATDRLVVTNPTPLPHESALSRSGEVSRTPVPPETHQGSPRNHPDYSQYHIIKALGTNAKDEACIYPVGDGPRVYNYTEALLAAKQAAESPDGVARPVAIMAIVDVFVPPERVPTHRYRIRRT